MKWGFVDYENTGSLEAFDLWGYERVFISLGPKNPKLKLGGIPSVGFCTLELISLNTMGPNNLDFHLAFHLGRSHELADKRVEFDVITNDAGFNGLVNHLKGLGRTCKKVATKKPKSRDPRSPQLSPCASLIVKKLAPLDERKRPGSRAKLINWIKSQCVKVLNGADPSDYYDELKKAQIVREAGSDVTYKFGG